MQGRGWEPGQLRQKLQQLVDKYKDVPKRPPFTYTGGNMGELSLPLYEPMGSLDAAATVDNLCASKFPSDFMP